MAQKPKTDEATGPAWPVTKPSDLTQEHLPQQLRDELERPHRARAERLARALIAQADSRNDLLTEIVRAIRNAEKDSERLNATAVGPLVMHDLRELGLLKQREAPK